MKILYYLPERLIWPIFFIFILYLFYNKNRLKFPEFPTQLSNLIKQKQFLNRFVEIRCNVLIELEPSISKRNIRFFVDIKQIAYNILCTRVHVIVFRILFIRKTNTRSYTIYIRSKPYKNRIVRREALLYNYK